MTTYGLTQNRNKTLRAWVVGRDPKKTPPTPKKIKPAAKSAETTPAPVNVAEVVETVTAWTNDNVVVTFAPLPEDGTPQKGDVFSIIKLEDHFYNDMRLPIPSKADNPILYPVYMIANQNGDLMKSVNDEDYQLSKQMRRAAELGWYYRNAGANGAELIIRDVKRLIEWQRKTYGKQAKPLEAETEVKLSCKVVEEGTRLIVLAETLKNALKGHNKHHMVKVWAYFFPIGILQEIAKLASGPTFDMTINQPEAREVQVKNSKGKPTGKTETRLNPSLTIRHGNTKTTIYGLSDEQMKGQNLGCEFII